MKLYLKLAQILVTKNEKIHQPIGSEITYSHQGFTDKGLLEFASFQRLKVKE